MTISHTKKYFGLWGCMQEARLASSVGCILALKQIVSGLIWVPINLKNNNAWNLIL